MAPLQLILQMLPFWLVGWFMIFITYKSQYRDLLRVDFKAVAKWIGFLAILTVYRYLVMHYLMSPDLVYKMTEASSWIPWQLTLTVFWEDAAHVLPILILARAMGDSKWAKPVTYTAIAFMMFAFGLGHVYQGTLAAIAISFYIPFNFKRSKEIGIGTIMICHCLYDLSTILLIQYLMRSM